jgi:hypothetical protein
MKYYYQFHEGIVLIQVKLQWRVWDAIKVILIFIFASLSIFRVDDDDFPNLIIIYRRRMSIHAMLGMFAGEQLHYDGKIDLFREFSYWGMHLREHIGTAALRRPTFLSRHEGREMR